MQMRARRRRERHSRSLTAARSICRRAGRLLFEKLVIANGGTFQAANDDWGTGCTAPCVTMAGGTLLGNAAGGNLYFNGFTFAANTTSTITSVNFFALSPTAGGSFLAGHVYDFQNGSVAQFGGLVTYSGGAQVTSTGTTGIVILSGGTLQIDRASARHWRRDRATDERRDHHDRSIGRDAGLQRYLRRDQRSARGGHGGNRYVCSNGDLNRPG